MSAKPTVKYGSSQPTREEIDRLGGPVVLEFGTDW